MTPLQVAEALAFCFGQAIYLQPARQKAIAQYLSPLGNQDMQALLQYLTQNPSVLNAVSVVLSPKGPPGTQPEPLDSALLGVLAPVLTGVSALVRGDSAFEGIGWQQVALQAPGPETPVPPGAGWSLAPLTAQSGVVVEDATWTGTGFALNVVNGLPRHLAVFAQFLSQDEPVVPSGWTSRLPDGVGPGFETGTLKYLDVLAPNAAVAGAKMAGGPQPLDLDWPDNADSVSLVLAGPGVGPGPGPALAAGMALSFVLDIFVPWVLARNAASGTKTDKWLRALAQDATVQASVLVAAAPLLKLQGGAAEMLTALGSRMTAIVTDPALAPLRNDLDKQAGTPDATAQAAPAAGWAAQMLAALLQDGTLTGYWPAATPAAQTLPLSPASALAVTLRVLPDPAAGTWPFGADRLTAELRYDAGWLQNLSQPLPEQGTAAVFDFGAVRNLAPMMATISAAAGGAMVATAAAALGPPDSGRHLTAQIVLRTTAPWVGKSWRYRPQAVFAAQGGTLVWQTGAVAPEATGLSPDAPGQASVSALGQLRWQSGSHVLAYVWQQQNGTIPDCSSGAQLQTAWRIQTIGAVVPKAGLGTQTCRAARRVFCMTGPGSP